MYPAARIRAAGRSYRNGHHKTDSLPCGGIFLKQGKSAHNGDMHTTLASRRTAAVIFLFFLFSFLGWAMEKLFVFLTTGVNADRGFLTLPFCTVYGTGLVLARLLFGEMRLPARYPWNALLLIGYIAAAAFLCTAAELSVGLIFEHVAGVRLWSYAGMPGEYLGYVCLPVSVGWGLMLPVVMRGIWLPLEGRLSLARGAWLPVVNAVLAVALAADFLVTLLV